MNRTRKHSSGLSLLETAVAAAIIAMIMGVIARTTQISSETSRMAKDHGRLTMMCQNWLGIMAEELNSAVRIYGRFGEGWGYWYYRDNVGIEPFPNSYASEIDSEGQFEQENSSGLKTGNILLFAKAAQTFPTDEEIQTWHQYCVSEGISQHANILDDVRIDVYRLLCYHLRGAGGSVDLGSPRSMDMVRWVSEPFADWDRILELDPADQPVVVRALNATELRGINYAWRPSEYVYYGFAEFQPDYSLFQVDIFGSHSGWRVPRDPRLTEDSLFIKRHTSVATVWAPDNYGVGKLNPGYNSGLGFPHGFEVQVVGPTAARQIMLHLVLINQIDIGQNVWVDLQQVVTCREQ